jgi:hypothetical protein
LTDIITGANLSSQLTDWEDRDVTVYGISEIGRALGVDPALVSKWSERNKLPAPDAVLSVGPVWLAATIEPLIEAGGPDRRRPGVRLTTFKITARMLAAPFPPVNDGHRRQFSAGIESLFSKVLLAPTAEWVTYNQAIVTLACQASDPDSAAASAKSIIMRQAQFTAQFAVREVEITGIEAMNP